MTIDRETFKKLRNAGMTVEEIAEFDRRSPPEGIPLSPAAEMMQPAAMTRRWLRAIPMVTGAVGALLPPPLGGIPGATVGGMAGRAAELGLGGQFPADLPSAIRDIAPAGIEQAALQAPASALGPASRGLIGMRDWARNRAINQAIKETRAIAATKDIRAPLSAAVSQAEATRKAAAATTAGALKGATGETITVGEVAEHVMRKQEALFGTRFSPEERTRFVAGVRQRIKEVLPEFTLGAVKGNRRVFGLEVAQVAKQAFQMKQRAAFEAAAGGVRPKPHLDAALADAWKELIEAKLPPVRDLNRATQAAIREEKALMRLQKGQPTEAVRQIKQEQTEASIKARLLAQRSGNPFQLFKGIPVRGGIARPGLSLRPGTFSEFGGLIGQGLAWPPLAPAAFYSPRLMALVAELLQSSPNERSLE